MATTVTVAVSVTVDGAVGGSGAEKADPLPPSVAAPTARLPEYARSLSGIRDSVAHRGGSSSDARSASTQKGSLSDLFRDLPR